MVGTSPIMTVHPRMSLRCFSGSAMRLRPTGGVVDELLDLRQHFRLELAARLRHAKDVFPRCQRMHRDARLTEDFLALRIDVVKENNETMLAFSLGVAN